MARFVTQHHRPTLVVSAVSVLVALVGMTKIEVSAHFLKLFDESARIRSDYEYVEQTLGGTVTLDVLLDTGEEGGVFEPRFLTELLSLEQWLEKYPGTRATISLTSVLKELNRVAHGDDPRFEVVPDTRQLASQLFLLYELGGSEEVDRLVSPERDVAHLSVRLVHASTREFEALKQDLEERAAAHVTTAKVQVTGQLPLFVTMVRYITVSQARTFGLAFAVVTLMMMLLFRSVRLGALAMLPNMLPVMVTFGFMGYRGITLNIGTVMIASIAIGIAVDDTIHFVSHFRRYRDAGLDVEEAIRSTTVGVGQAMVMTSVVLALGFSTFGFSQIAHLKNFGLLTALTVVTALVADFLMLPALLLWLRPGGSSRRSVGAAT